MKDATKDWRFYCVIILSPQQGGAGMPERAVALWCREAARDFHPVLLPPG